ncbi:MAG: hypothetical protein KAR87_00175 [Candidatus Aenigmarchaeota archaeon]|nr:hypothetical protein [Candidatus Aenigmarchaeota archaeon]
MSQTNEKGKKGKIDKKALNKILKKYGYADETPDTKYDEEIGVSKEFEQYRSEDEAQKKLNWYEQGAKFAQKVFNIAPPKEDEYNDLRQAINFLDYKVTIEETFSMTYLAALLSLPLAILPFSLATAGLPIPKILMIAFIFLPLVIYYSFSTYIQKKANMLRMKVGGDLVMAILYLIIYMKTTPNLEGAIRFTAKNMSGKISKDFKLLMWKVEIGKFSNMYDALDDYLNQWHNYNRDFIESIHLIRESMLESNPYRRETLLDKSVSIILEGSQEKMKKYVRNLSMPIAVLHGLGILLPVLAMLMFPLMAIFMGDAIGNLVFYMFIGYDIILPFFVFIFMKNIMEGRPVTHSKVDITEHPDYTSEKNIVVGLGNKKMELPVLPIALFVLVVLALPGVLFMLQSNFFYTNPITGEQLETNFFSTIMSLSIIIAVGFSTILYFYLSSFQKIHLTEEIDFIENEFEDALFALGNRMSGGTPIESAIAEAQRDTQQLSITSLFLKILQNINQMSMPFSKALFDKERGALRYYPSKLIKTIMQAISSAIKKGTKSASLTTLTIASYLHSLKNTQSTIDELMAPTISSLKFQSYILIPLISGVVVAVSKLMMTIVFILTKQLEKIGEATAVSEMGVGGNFGMMNIISPNAVPPELLQLIVGIYIIETLILMAKFTVRIDTGEDEIKENVLCWHFLLIGLGMYVLVYIILGAMFNPLIEGIVGGLSTT